MGYLQNRVPLNSAREFTIKSLISFLNLHPEVVLEFGPGRGEFIRNITAKDKYVVDSDPDSISSLPPDVTCILGDWRKAVDFGKNFDLIWASNFLEHLDDISGHEFLTLAKSLLKPDGVIIFLQPNFKYAYRQYFDDWDHKSIYTHISLSDKLRYHGFAVSRIYPKILPFSVKSRGGRFYRIVPLYIRLPYKPFAGQMLICASNNID